MNYQLDPLLSTVSSRFAAELRELTFAIERGQDITPRLRVLREFWRTWQELADVIVARDTPSARPADDATLAASVARL